jgi:hypothetical protein
LFAPPGQPWPGDEHLVPVSVAAARFAQMAALPPLPADFEKGLEDLESTLASIVKATNRVTEGVQTATHQIAALRLRAQQDQAALSRLQAIQEALKG